MSHRGETMGGQLSHNKFSVFSLNFLETRNTLFKVTAALLELCHDLADEGTDVVKRRYGFR